MSLYKQILESKCIKPLFIHKIFVTQLVTYRYDVFIKLNYLLIIIFLTNLTILENPITLKCKNILF